eukprot:COSAG02_NODE_47098_length_343_cov_1.401639_1_plen_75_part_01
MLSMKGFAFIGVRLSVDILDSHAEVGLLSKDDSEAVIVCYTAPGATVAPHRTMPLVVGKYVRVALGVALNISVG